MNILILQFLQITPEYDVPIRDDDEFITLNAFYEPIELDSLSKDLKSEYIVR